VSDLQKIKKHYLLADCDVDCPCLRVRSSLERKARARQIRRKKRALVAAKSDEEDDNADADTDTTSDHSSDESDSGESELDDLLDAVERKQVDFREGAQRLPRCSAGSGITINRTRIQRTQRSTMRS
jgi:hypothetical protein